MLKSGKNAEISVAAELSESNSHKTTAEFTDQPPTDARISLSEWYSSENAGAA